MMLWQCVQKEKEVQYSYSADLESQFPILPSIIF